MSLLKPRIPSGCGSLDRFLEGGLPPGGITLLYGEAETGKTTLAMQYATNSARMGYKTFFVDSDGTFSPERLSQIASTDFEETSALIILAEPSTFQEQTRIIDYLEESVGGRFGLIVFDTITSLYRFELGDKKETFRLNRELNRQAATLAQIAKTLEIPVLLTSQVRSVLDLGEASVEPVASRVLKFWSNVVISLRTATRRNVVQATIEKPTKGEKKPSFHLIIEKDGIHDYIHR